MAKKLLGVIAVLVLAAFLYHLDALTGRWKLEGLCRSEGGPHIYDRVEKDVG